MFIVIADVASILLLSLQFIVICSLNVKFCNIVHTKIYRKYRESRCMWTENLVVKLAALLLSSLQYTQRLCDDWIVYDGNHFNFIKT